MQNGLKNHQSGKLSLPRLTLTAAGTALAMVLFLSGCKTEQVLANGPVITENDLALVPVGSSRDQVLLALGSPSTTGTFDNEVFYYISQKRQRNLAFQKLTLVDQRVVAIYFDENEIVYQVADYGLQDGKVFDFISRTTPTGGKDQTFLGRIFAGNSKSSTAVPQLPGAN
jgi:outer membrane protein assembly factor BamE (lipoprotein component of BamABCDE complex)